MNKEENKTINMKISGKTQCPKNKGKILYDKALPIKDIKLIKQIKESYKIRNDYKGLLLFLIAINTGLKIDELLSLKVGDVLNRDILSVFNSFSKEILTFILTKEIKEIVPMVVGERKKDDFLFKTRFGNKLDRITVYRNFGEITRSLGIADKYSLLSWRKTFAYHYFKQTKDITKIMYIFHQTTVQQAFEFIDEEQTLNHELDKKFAL